MISNSTLIISEKVNQSGCFLLRILDLLKNFSPNLPKLNSDSQSSTLVEERVHGLNLSKQLFVGHGAIILLKLHDSLIEKFVNKGHSCLNKEVGGSFNLDRNQFN